MKTLVTLTCLIAGLVLVVCFLPNLFSRQRTRTPAEFSRTTDQSNILVNEPLEATGNRLRSPSASSDQSPGLSVDWGRTTPDWLASVGLLVMGGFVSQDGLPLTDVEINLEIGAGARTLSDHQGGFRLEYPSDELIVQHKAYRLTAIRPGYAMHEQSLVFGASGVLDIGTVKLAPGASVAGTVLHARNGAGRNIDVFVASAASDAESIHVEEAFLRDLPGGTIRQTQTDRDGRYRIEGLPVGRWQVWARAQGSFLAASAPFQLEAGVPHICGPIQLHELPAQLQISGVVVSEDGTPVPTAWVSYQRIDGIDRGTISTDGEGNFSFHARAAGARYRLRASAPEGWEFWEGEESESASGARDVRLKLKHCSEIVIQVSDKLQNPVERFGWSWERGDLGSPVILDASGSAPRPGGSIRLCRPHQAERLKVIAPGFEPLTIECIAELVASGELYCSLRSLPYVSGRVVGTDAEPAAGVLVQICPIEAELGEGEQLPPWKGRAIASARTDMEGRFRIGAQRAGKFRLGVSGSEVMPHLHGEVSIPESGGLDALVVQLAGAAQVHGLVNLSDGSSPAGARIEAIRGDRVERSCTVDLNSNYSLGPLAPGDVGIRLLGPGSQDPGLVSFVHLGVGEHRRVDLDLASPQRVQLSGRISFGGRVFADGFTVNCWTSASLVENNWRAELRTATTPHDLVLSAPVRADGRFALSLVEGGSYMLRLAGSAGYHSQLRLERTITLAASQRLAVDIDLSWGSVLLEGKSLSIAELRDFYIECLQPHAEVSHAQISGTFGSNQTMIFPIVPQGEVLLCRGARGGPRTEHSWIKVTPGSTTLVRL